MKISISRQWKAGGARPDDLRTVCPESELMRMALDAVAEVAPTGRGRWVDAERGEAVSGAMLLTLLCYAYAVGVYGSEEIEEACQSDQAFRYLCAGRVPGWSMLRRFRRANRALLTRCLAAVLRRVSRGTGSGEAGRCRSGRWAPGRICPLGLDLRSQGPGGWIEEADRRVGRAVLADTMAMDL